MHLNVVCVSTKLLVTSNVMRTPVKVLLHQWDLSSNRCIDKHSIFSWCLQVGESMDQNACSGCLKTETGVLGVAGYTAAKDILTQRPRVDQRPVTNTMVN